MNPIRLFTIRAMSPIHCGIGQGIGDIDLPTARESVTGFPYIPGSSIKGVYKDYWRRQSGSNDDPALKCFRLAFGKDPGDVPEKDFASALSFSDARILLLPVRSYKGTFSYATSPLVLQRLKADLRLAGRVLDCAVPAVATYGVAVGTDSMVASGGKVMLEDLDLTTSEGTAAAIDSLTAALGRFFDQDWQGVFSKRLALVSDDVFSFLCETALPVIARVCIDNDTGIVKDGALWYEEAIPVETVLIGHTALQVYGGGSQSDFDRYISGQHFLQIGGNATVGQGMSELRFLDGGQP